MKKDVVEAFAKLSNISKKTADEVLDIVLISLAAVLAKDGTVSLGAIGILKVVKRAARQGRNPKTGEAINIPEKKTVVLKAGKEMKKLLNT